MNRMNNISWEYHTPVFESDRLNPEMMMYSPWSGHRRFAYDLTANRKPACIVELGSYYGCSAFTFLQAVKDFHLDSSFYAIDTWEGDSFTESDYRENIFESYREIQDQCFGNQNAFMMQMTFDDANDRFEDGSIDLLHIDGSHTYEDCKHDFETWLPKVKSDGIILFHDISDDTLNGELLGSHIFWEELKEQHPLTMEFLFSFGLGVLFLNEEVCSEVSRAIRYDYYQQMENHAAVSNKDVIRKRYFQLRDAENNIGFLEDQLSVTRSHLQEYERTQKEKDLYIEELEAARQDRETEARQTQAEYEKNLAAYRRDIEAKDRYIEELTGTMELLEKEREKAVQDYQSTLSGKESYIRELQQSMEDLNSLMHKYEETVSGKDRYIEELQQSVRDFHILMQKYEETVSGKDEYIEELQETIGKYAENVSGKDRYIDELTDRQQTLIRQCREEQENAAVIAGQYAELRAKIEGIPFGRRLLNRWEAKRVEN